MQVLPLLYVPQHAPGMFSCGGPTFSQSSSRRRRGPTGNRLCTLSSSARSQETLLGTAPTALDKRCLTPQQRKPLYLELHPEFRRNIFFLTYMWLAVGTHPVVKRLKPARFDRARLTKCFPCRTIARKQIIQNQMLCADVRGHMLFRVCRGEIVAPSEKVLNFLSTLPLSCATSEGYRSGVHRGRTRGGDRKHRRHVSGLAHAKPRAQATLHAVTKQPPGEAYSCIPVRRSLMTCTTTCILSAFTLLDAEDTNFTNDNCGVIGRLGPARAPS